MAKRTNDSRTPTMTPTNNDESRTKYGELVVLGCNGFLPQGNKGRRRSKFELYKRNEPNGVKESKHYVIRTPQNGEPKLNIQQHSISYTLSPNQTVIVEYENDAQTDMFQVGRSNESSIDLVVMGKVKNSNRSQKVLPNGKKEVRKIQPTVSRFACRILVERSTGNAKIFAAAFDSNKTIFLGEKATKWQQDMQIDGLTTNGVLIMHPRGQFIDGDAQCSVWHECSIGGDILSQRETRSAPQKGRKIQEEMNVLNDGTLINLGAMTLLWRSAEGLESTPRYEDLSKLFDELNVGIESSDCINTIVIPRQLTSEKVINQPYVYLNCGHVEVNPDWEIDATDKRMCKKCVKLGPVVRLCMGIETSVYVDSGPATFAFNPCGHITTEKTVKYWSNVDIPHGTAGFQAECPFCSAPLLEYPGYVALIF